MPGLLFYVDLVCLLFLFFRLFFGVLFRWLYIYLFAAFLFPFFHCIQWILFIHVLCVSVIISLRNRSSYISKVMGFDAMIVCLYAKNKGLTKMGVWYGRTVFSFSLFIYVKRCCLLFYQYLWFVCVRVCVYFCVE